MKWREEYKKLLNDNHISIHEYQNSEDIEYELEFHSNAGEDCIFTVSKEDFVTDLYHLSEEFDPEEHVEMWVEAKQNNSTTGIPDVFTLVEDAKWIQSFLKEIAEKVRDRRNELCTSL